MFAGDDETSEPFASPSPWCARILVSMGHGNDETNGVCCGPVQAQQDKCTDEVLYSQEEAVPCP